MAIVANPFDTGETDDTTTNNQAQGQNPTLGGSAGASGGVGGGVGGNGSNTATSSAPALGTPTNSGSFQNLSKYINANQNFDSSTGGLAGAVAGNIGGQAQQQQQNIQGAQNAFNTAAQNNVNVFNPGASTVAANNQAIINNASGITDPSQFNQITAAENANYTGPTDLNSLQGSQNLTNLTNQNSNISNEANQTQSQAGQYNLLRQMFGSPTYTTGQQNLDQLILNSTPGAQQQFGQANQAASGLGQNLNAAQQVAQATSAQNQALASNIAASTQGALNTGVNSIYTADQGQIPIQQAAAAAALAQAQTDVANGTATPAEQAALQAGGMNLTQGQYLYGLNPANYITSGAGNATGQNVLTQTQYNNLQALQQLASANPNALTAANSGNATTLTSNPYNAATAYNPNALTFGTSATGGPSFSNALNTAQTTFNTSADAFGQNFLQSPVVTSPQLQALAQNLETNPNGATSASDLSQIQALLTSYLPSNPAQNQHATSNINALLTQLQGVMGGLGNQYQVAPNTAAPVTYGNGSSQTNNGAGSTGFETLSSGINGILNGAAAAGDPVRAAPLV